jgi:hypothetical protein
MRLTRFTIASLLGLVALIALGAAALVGATPEWARWVLSLALATLAVATLGGLFARGPARAFWAGFALVGWSCLFAPDSIRSELVTTRWIARLSSALHPLQPQPNRPADLGSYRTYYDVRTKTYLVDVGGKVARAEQVGQTLLALLLALAGGLVARGFADADWTQNLPRWRERPPR